MTPRREKDRRPRGAAPRRKPAAADAPRATARRPRVTRALALAGALAVVALALVWWRRPHPAADPSAALSDQAMLDSVYAADAVRDGATELLWAHRLLDRLPDDAMRRLLVGRALHNSAWTARSDHARSARRTSLQRMRLERAAFEYFDAAAMRARTPEEAAKIGNSLGQLYENLGLPVEALASYSHVLQGTPREPGALPRALYLNVHLHDPLAADTARTPHH